MCFLFEVEDMFGGRSEVWRSARSFKSRMDCNCGVKIELRSSGHHVCDQNEELVACPFV
jgi:hypothetical protein